jgi:SAM-dependent methyltransferase
MPDYIHNWKEIMNCEDSQYKDSKWEDNINYMSFLLKYTRPGKWLDVGCGLGLFVECCERYGLDCYGLEGDSYAVESAKKRYGNLHVQTHNILDTFPFDSNSFSAIFCNQVIEHIPAEHAEFIFNEIYRVLSDDGVVFINMPNKYNKAGREESSHINLMSPDTLFCFLKQAGFKTIIPTLYPKFILGNNLVSKILSGVLFFLIPLDRLSANASAIAIKHNGSFILKNKRSFFVDKLLIW